MPRVRLVRAANGLTAYLAFPKAMDARYLKDVDALSHDGVPARSVRASGNMLIAEFAPTNLKTVTIRGTFGRKYFYGDLMGFAATGR
jgi:hypothetical protein